MSNDQVPKLSPEAKVCGQEQGSGHVARVPLGIGLPLNHADYTALEKESWITPEIADAAFLRRLSDAEGREAIGQKGRKDCSGILIPCYWPGEPRPHSYRIRRDNPEWRQGKDGKAKPDRKYLGAPGSTNRLYFPPGVTPEQLHDAALPIVIVEGEKKALALQRLAWHEVETPRFIPVAISGVWNWRGTVGKAGGPHGERVDVKGPINDLNRIIFAERTVFILFDADAGTNDGVKWARKGIARELMTRQAKVKSIDLPKDCGVKGIDNLLAAWGPARVLDLFARAASSAILEVNLSPQFRSTPEGMFRITTKGEQVIKTQLTNYQAEIVSNTRLDDGIDVARELEIKAELFGRRSCFTMSASEFMAMTWPIERLGAAAITYPRQNEYARTAIQSCSITAEERSIYTHTGWRCIDGHWMYLHSGGAIGHTGIHPGVSVDLPRSLARYALRLPSTPDGPVSAIKASLRFLVPSICLPLRAATIRAVFGTADFSVHLVGETGAFKSELAALEQQFFGSAMDRMHLPGSWSSTPNALEMQAFHAKDALLGIDDYAPQSNPAESGRLQATADRILRAAGNGSGRGRLDSNAKLRDSKPPRCMILSTGEDIPRGHSIRARLLVLEIEKGSIDSGKLAECQRAAQAGLYAEAMCGFVMWLAGHYEEKCAEQKARALELRMDASGNAAHARTPDMIATLQAALEIYLEYAEGKGAIDADTRLRISGECWQALVAAAAGQANHQAASEPAARYIELLRSCLASGLAHLASREGNAPKLLPADCGWRPDRTAGLQPQGRCVGWTDGPDIFLEPTAAYEVVQGAARNAGEVFPVAEPTLRKRLRDKGCLASMDEKRGTLAVRRTICGSSKGVLHLLRSTVLPAGQATDSETGDTEQ